MNNLKKGHSIAVNGVCLTAVEYTSSSFKADVMPGTLEATNLSNLKRGSEVNIEVAWVPGSFEIPLTAKKMADSDKYDDIICLGAVIRGETPHFNYVSSEVSKGVAKVGLDAEIPVIFGVLTTDTIEQAISRAGTKSGNKGYEAAESLIEMVNLLDQF